MSSPSSIVVQIQLQPAGGLLLSASCQITAEQPLSVTKICHDVSNCGHKDQLFFQSVLIEKCSGLSLLIWRHTLSKN